jgi:thiamine biosynthesis protein ThiC
MLTCVIDRRNAWQTPEALQVAAARSTRVGNEEMPEDVRRIRSYVVRHDDGKLGTVCIYQATSVAAVREHARRAGLRADGIRQVEDTVIVRPDPAAAN